LETKAIPDDSAVQQLSGLQKNYVKEQVVLTTLTEKMIMSDLL